MFNREAFLFAVALESSMRDEHPDAWYLNHPVRRRARRRGRPDPAGPSR